MFDYYETKVFLEAARYQNFTLAAESLYISQSSLSKTIARLEGELGFALFERTGRTVRLSREGKIVYEKMREVLKELDDAILHARQMTQNKSGTFTLSCSESWQMPAELLQAVHDFRRQEPQFSYELCEHNFHNFRKDLMSGEIDSVVVRDFSVSNLFGCNSIVLCRSMPVIMVRKGHPAVGADGRIDMKKLASYAFVALYSSAHVLYSDNLYKCCKVNGFRPEMIRFVKDPAAKTNCLMLEDFAMVTDELEAKSMGDHVVYEQVEGVSKTDFILVWRSDNRNPALLRFIDFIKERTPFEA